MSGVNSQADKIIFTIPERHYQVAPGDNVTISISFQIKDEAERIRIKTYKYWNGRVFTLEDFDFPNADRCAFQTCSHSLTLTNVSVEADTARYFFNVDYARADSSGSAGNRNSSNIVVVPLGKCVSYYIA